MRWTNGLVVLIVVGLANSAFGLQSDCAGCGGCAKSNPWYAEACAAPAGYTLAPGCCEEHRRCCDNAWDGYCDHRARVEACWARVGANTCYCGPQAWRFRWPFSSVSSDACTSCTTPVDQPSPTPAVAPTPASPARIDQGRRYPYQQQRW
jgi:hypothetical protein